MPKTANKKVFESVLSDIDSSMCALSSLEDIASNSAPTNLNQIAVRHAMKALAGEAVQEWSIAHLKCEAAWRASKMKNLALAKACDGIENALNVFKIFIDVTMCEDIAGDEFSRPQKDADSAVTIGLMRSAVLSLNNAISALGGVNLYVFDSDSASEQSGART